MSRNTFASFGHFYGILQLLLGFGDLWMHVGRDSIQFDWHPDKNTRIVRHVSHIAICSAVSLEAIAGGEAVAMRQKYRDALIAATA